ncbi:MAG: ribosome biogenesis GTPase Der [Alphaproteobacteria bacterium]|nr:ribosome biogenesis GTPase Der [Alphaproteobacteria bacterium]
MSERKSRNAPLRKKSPQTAKPSANSASPPAIANKRDTVRARISHQPAHRHGDERTNSIKRVIILGRPNVGKSTLFNRLVGQRLAMVDDQPGVTRDWRQAAARIDDLAFDLIDTAGFELYAGQPSTELTARITARTLVALKQADVILFVFDARAGVTPLDRELAQTARMSGLPVICLANKAESRTAAQIAVEGFELGLGEAIPFSAEHGVGLTELYDALKPMMAHAAEIMAGDFTDAGDMPRDEPPLTEADWAKIEALAANEQAETDTDADVTDSDADAVELAPISLAVVGRPNVGKSTLVNCLLGEERMMTGPEAGLTRESIAAELWHKAPSGVGGAAAAPRCIRLIDTAGIRRKKQWGDALEQLSVSDSLRTIRFAEMVVLVVDGTAGLERQDLTLASMVTEEGRGLVIAINKWDAVIDKNECLAEIKDKLEQSLPQIRGVPLVTISAIKGIRVTQLLDQVLRQYKLWQSRISTGAVNRWLSRAISAHPPPLFMGHAVRMRYATQIKTRPPSLVIFSSRPDQVPDSYMRYLIGNFRDYFDLPGIPIRMSLRKGKNPYAGG